MSSHEQCRIKPDTKISQARDGFQLLNLFNLGIWGGGGGWAGGWGGGGKYPRPFTLKLLYYIHGIVVRHNDVITVEIFGFLSNHADQN